MAAISLEPKTQILASGLIFAMAGWATYNFYAIGRKIYVNKKQWINRFYLKL
jgi:hypothetical protein